MMKRITTTTWTSSLDNSPLGLITFTVTKRGLVSVDFGSPANLDTAVGSKVEEIPASPQNLLEEIERQLAAYFSGKLKIFDIPTDWGGLSSFQQKAMKAAQEIPYGQIKSYSQLASDMGQLEATRAVGGAMARNPMPIIIPCHRVVAADGHLTGYSGSGGLETKAWLLRLEGHQVRGQRVIID